jgi:TatA/E family protein of Tat protein translocase
LFDLGTQELIVIFIVAFLVFGPKKLPELGRTLGKGIRDLKAAMRGVKDSLDEAGADVTEELKSAKSDLEDSIYKSIEPQITNTEESKEGNKDAEEDKKDSVAAKEVGKEVNSDSEENRKTSVAAKEVGKEEKETDKDG